MIVKAHQDRTVRLRALLRRLHVGDIALAGLGLLLAGMYSVLLVDYGLLLPYVLNVIAHIGLALALLVRRIWVRASFVATYSLLGSLVFLTWVSPVALGVTPALLSAPLSLWTVARRDRDHRWGIVALLLGVVGSFVSPINDWSAVFVPLQVLLCVGVYLLATHLRRTELVHAAKLKSYSAQAESAERARIARELHDIIAHSLTVVGVQARTGLAIGTPEQLRSSLEAVSTSVNEAITEARSMVYMLREDTPERSPEGDLRRLPDLLASTRASGVNLKANLPTEAILTQWQSTWPVQLRLTVLRIVQESLTNIVKHGGSVPNARLEVTPDDGVLHLKVTNDQITATSSEPGYGLIGLRERVNLMGGTIETGILHDRFVVSACLPLPKTLKRDV